MRGVARSVAWWLLLCVVLAGALLGINPVVAQAAEDGVTALSVDFDIQPDGSVAVRYELDWRFSSAERHGIDFSIATRESWDADRSKDVVYDVSDIAVSSPSGAPAQFTRTTRAVGSVGSIDLRIGDPDVTVGSRDATYVISYKVKGALRSVDDAPEFFWDVTNGDFPDIDHFTVTIHAPGGVLKARCLMGQDECSSEVVDGEAVLTGTGVKRGTILSAVARPTPGAVTNYEPILEERRLLSPQLTKVVGVVDVLADSTMHVQQELSYRLPPVDAPLAHLVRWDFPIRRPVSREQDQVFTISNLRVEGADAPFEQDEVHEPGRSSQDLRVQVATPVGDDTVTLTLNYDVKGAVHVTDDVAHVRWFLSPDSLHEATTVDFTWNLPGEVQRTGCKVFSGHADEPRDCVDQVQPDGDHNTVSWRLEDGERLSPLQMWFTADVPATSLTAVSSKLEPSLAAAARREKVLSSAGAVVALGALAVGGSFLGRMRFRADQRWVGTPPGVTAPSGTATRSTWHRDSVPVRFNEPDCSLLMAGLVYDRRPEPRHAASVLVHMATSGAVQIQSKPLVVKRISEDPPADSLEVKLFEQATTRATKLGGERQRKMVQAVEKAQERALGDTSLFFDERPTTLRRRVALVSFAVVVVAVFVVARWLIPGWLGPYGGYIAAAALIGALVGILHGVRRKPRRSLGPAGTALRDQVEGFRHFLATAEAEQLNFEADHDIYRRYLPWAVLFGLTKRWTKVCEELAAAGRVPALDTSFWAGPGSATTIAHGLPAMPGAFKAVGSSSSDFFSGSGSGGSSGFSGGSFGGGGGGGTSASSW